jgi:hypothetical protein
VNLTRIEKYLEGRCLSTGVGESLEVAMSVYSISSTEHPNVRPCFTISDCVIETLGWLLMRLFAF